MGALAPIVPIITQIGAAVSAVQTVRSVLRKPKMPAQAELTGINDQRPVSLEEESKPKFGEDAEVKYKRGLTSYLQHLAHQSPLIVGRNRENYERGYQKYIQQQEGN